MKADIASETKETSPAQLPAFLPGGTGGKRTLILIAAAVVLLTLSIAISTQVSTVGTVKRVAVMIHALSFVLGFGAVLSVMLCGLRVVLGKLAFSVAAKTAVTVDPGIWLGFALMVSSGALLNPNLLSNWMRAKLVLSLLACVNGILALPSMKTLLTLPTTGGLEVVPRPLRVQLLTQTTISQLSWWAMVFISYLELRS